MRAGLRRAHHRRRWWHRGCKPSAATRAGSRRVLPRWTTAGWKSRRGCLFPVQARRIPGRSRRSSAPQAHRTPWRRSSGRSSRKPSARRRRECDRRSARGDTRRQARRRRPVRSRRSARRRGGERVRCRQPFRESDGLCPCGARYEKPGKSVAEPGASAITRSPHASPAPRR